MKERPILFNGEMVQAILDGRKTVTRRVVKPSNGLQSKWASVESLSKCPSNYLCEVDGILGAQFQHPHAGKTIEDPIVGKVEVGLDSPYGWFRCPYGKPGDRLYVRETWCNIAKPGREPEIYYRADAEDPMVEDYDQSEWKWKPSIHMPRWVSRILLEVTDVRVERVQEITWQQIRAEGVSWVNKPGHEDETIYDAFQQLWNSINAARGYSWESNPWIWVVEFKVSK